MPGNDDAKVAAVGSVGALVAAIWAGLKSGKVAAGELPKEVIELLLAIAASSDEIRKTVHDILATLGQGGQGWPSNANAVTAVRVLVAIAGTQMPFIAIPSGMTLVIKAYALNPGWLQVGATQGESTQVNQSFPLLPNEVVTYQIENADQLWIAGSVAGCYACLTVEQRRLGGG